MNKFLVGLGIALAMLLVFTVPAAADNVVYFDPDPSYAAPGEGYFISATETCTLTYP